jgi:hypothetical protein
VDIARLAVDLVQALAWPAVLLGVVIVFRLPLTFKVNDLLSVKGGGVEVTFQIPGPSDEALTKELAGSAQRLAAGLSHTGSSLSAEELRRKDVEELIHDAIVWGYRNAGAFGAAPEPRIDWAEDGRPSITFPNVPRSSGRWEIHQDSRGQYRWRLKAETVRFLRSVRPTMRRHRPSERSSLCGGRLEAEVWSNEFAPDGPSCRSDPAFASSRYHARVATSSSFALRRRPLPGAGSAGCGCLPGDAGDDYRPS